MSDWLLNLPVVWMAIVIFAATYLFAAVLYTVITAHGQVTLRLAARRCRGRYLQVLRRFTAGDGKEHVAEL
jgi:hypothetical protein